MDEKLIIAVSGFPELYERCIALEPGTIKAELLDQPVILPVEMPASQHLVNPDGPAATGPPFPPQICRSNTKETSKRSIHGERGYRCGLLYRSTAA